MTTPIKPGYLTTEFWFTLLAQLIGALYASGLVGAGTTLDHALGFATMVMTQLGYSVSRGITKAAHAAAAANDNAAVVAADTAKAIAAARNVALAGFVSVRLVSMLAIVGLVAGASLASCGARSKAGEQAFISCIEADVQAKIPSLLPTVESILTSGVSDWKAQLEALAAYAGKDALACTVKAAEAAFAHKLGDGSGAAPAARENAETFIKDHGWVYR